MVFHNQFSSYRRVKLLGVAQYYIIIDHAIQINVGQKDKENQWRVVDLEGFLYTALLYQVMTNRNINTVTSLEQYSVLVKKE